MDRLLLYHFSIFFSNHSKMRLQLKECVSSIVLHLESIYLATDENDQNDRLIKSTYQLPSDSWPNNSSFESRSRMEEKRKICSCTGKDPGCTPTRYVMVFLLFWCCFLTYLARTSINLTIVSMVNDTDVLQNNQTGDFSDQCPYRDEDLNYVYNSTVDNSVQKSTLYSWDATTQSLILSSFYFGYICTQIPGGFLADRFGSKWLLGGATLAGAVLTLLTPLSASYGVAFLVAVRIVGGLAQGVIYPSCVVFMSLWIPKEERSFVTTFVFMGGSIGTIFSMEVGGYLCKHGFAGGWPSVYYVFGSMSFLWFILWAAFAYNSPEDHPRISDKEKLHIRNAAIQTSKQPPPWKSVFTSMPILALLVASGSSAWSAYMLLSELPTYLQHVLHFPVDQNGSINSVVYVIGTLVSLSFARLSDWLISTRKANTTLTRKTMQNLGHYGSAACFLCIAFLAGCDRTIVISLLMLSKAMSSIAAVSDYVVPTDMAPMYSGTIFGMGNSMSAVMGLLSPMITGLFLKDGMSQLSHWRWIFCITAGSDVFGAIFFLIFGSAERQKWATPPDDEERCIQNSKE